MRSLAIRAIYSIDRLGDILTRRRFCRPKYKADLVVVSREIYDDLLRTHTRPVVDGEECEIVEMRHLFGRRLLVSDRLDPDDFYVCVRGELGE